MTTREDCVGLDSVDSLGALRDEFVLRDSQVYLDGNSLGPLTRSAAARVRRVVEHEWAEGLVISWGGAGWMGAPTRLGERLAPLLGARAGEVVVDDTLTISLAKLIGGALALRPERHVLLTDAANFHSDVYISRAMARRAGREVRVATIDRNRLEEYLDDEVALVVLTHVDFRTGEMLDLAGVTEKVHAAGALMLWDFAHSIGAVPLDVTGAHVDFAAGCTYKYLNAGPGAPGFLYVRSSWQGVIENPLPGWLGHARPFDFDLEYVPAPGMQAFVTSSPPIVALAALDGALEVWDRVTIDQVRAKSLVLTDLFIDLLGERLPGVFEVVTPTEHARRGSQVSLRFHHAYGLVQALIERGVIGDFRDPDIARFGFAPLYLRYVDVFDAVEHFVQVVTGEEYLAPRFAVRHAVT